MRTVHSSRPPMARASALAAATRPVLVALALMLVPTTAFAQHFDFDSAPVHSSLPISLTVGGVTAQFSASGSGFSIQPANTLGFTPAGFGGLCLYPNSVFAADLSISFDQVL